MLTLAQLPGLLVAALLITYVHVRGRLPKAESQNPVSRNAAIRNARCCVHESTPPRAVEIDHLPAAKGITIMKRIIQRLHKVSFRSLWWPPSRLASEMSLEVLHDG
ncbi:hypothetical protein LVJ94_05510 [Pendulispora rubella]|uniref:Secreted protein n=1 Tax=Pendulispora rubella TaxID=2741070 RepID=A0ABZ2LAT9_9BACT